MSRNIWDPVQYGVFADHRGRPFHELAARIAPAGRRQVVGHVVDLGCGSGELTATLARRWPDARVEGVDGSAAMIERASAHADGEQVRFTLGDIATWRAPHPIDVIVSAAALQWVPGHQAMLPGWVDALTSGGQLAFTVPGNFDAPSHAILRELCTSPRWRADLAGTVRHDVVSEPAEYLRILTEAGCAVDAWETTYLQVLHGDAPVLEWVRGTALRPVLAALDGEDAKAAFLDEYGARLARAYPARNGATVLPFRRIFVVARRTA